MTTLTIRNLPEALADALEKEKRRRGESLNQTVIDLLSQGLGVGGSRSNGLRMLGGTWTDRDLQQFDEAVAPFEHIDKDVWR